MTIVAHFDPCPEFNTYRSNSGKPVSGLCVCTGVLISP